MKAGDGMTIRIFEDTDALERSAASRAAELIRGAIRERGTARLLASAGPAQPGVLAALAQQPGIAWGEVELFQPGEYIGLGVAHRSALRHFLFEHVINPTRVGRYHLFDGEHDPAWACRVAGDELTAAPIDVAFAEVGENGGIGFNHPPADFQTEKPNLNVRLEETYRRTRVDDGAFTSFVDAPERAISISIRQLLKAKAILCVVPAACNAGMAKRCLEGSISPLAPASILRTHPHVTVYLHRDSAALLAKSPPLE
jgi:glucosamine-6-phosphate deaminase